MPSVAARRPIASIFRARTQGPSLGKAENRRFRRSQPFAPFLYCGWHRRGELERAYCRPPSRTPCTLDPSRDRTRHAAGMLTSASSANTSWRLRDGQPSPVLCEVSAVWQLSDRSFDGRPHARDGRGNEPPAYFMVSDSTAAKTTSWTSWTSWRSYMCGTIPRTPSASNGTGVPSLAISGKKAFLFFG